ncbi:Alpha/beta-hydrolase [Paragonimus heterotremus]|uniref:sn-1-specific diacylglycerol lipase ABHD11 n=1 Tax=Paragonimus heterotremus TaxID=100268 RepID=A0A8J4T509_9TREM|nr:Alpha/beta-hydrolase [Paragonimus heterotremus]
MSRGLQLAHSLIRSVDPLLKSTVLICHGLFGSKQNWKTLSHAMHRNGCGSICTVDLRNHGLSPHSLDMNLIAMGHDVIKVVDDLQLQDVCLVGHSLGGKAVMCAALLEPQKFTRLIVLDVSPVYTSKIQHIMPYVRLMHNADLYRAERESDGTLNGVRQWLMDTWESDVPDEAMRRFLLTNLDQVGCDFVWRVNLKAIESCWQYIVGFPKSELEGRTFDGPTMFVASGRSNYVDVTDFPAIHAYFPHARLVRMRDAGHWLQVDDPRTVLKLITNFVKGPAETLMLDTVDDLTDECTRLL